MFQWVSADLLTGRVIADLPGLEPQWPLKRTISADESATATLYLTDATPGNWPEAIRPGSVVLACYDDTDPAQAIQWAGYVPDRPQRAVATDQVQVTMVTGEALLDRAYVGDTTYTTSTARNNIIADLITSWFTPGTGIHMGMSYTAGDGPSPAAALVLQNTDNATVKARLDQICAQLGGEYTVKWAWTNNHQAITPTLVFGTRIGTVALPGMAPLVSFDGPNHMGGSIIDLNLADSFAADSGANKVVAYSSGQGSTTPYGTPAFAPADGRPIFEFRWQPKASVSPEALTQYAQQAVKILGPGKQTITAVLTRERPDGRRFGSDWDLGDDIGLSYPSQYTSVEGVTVPIRCLPDGLDTIVRPISVEMDETTYTPTFAETLVYVDAAG